MAEHLRWKEILKRYPDQWVALINFKDDPDYPTRTEGEILAVAKTARELADKLMKEPSNAPVSLEYVGLRVPENFWGGIWPQPTE